MNRQDVLFLKSKKTKELRELRVQYLQELNILSQKYEKARCALLDAANVRIAEAEKERVELQTQIDEALAQSLKVKAEKMRIKVMSSKVIEELEKEVMRSPHAYDRDRLKENIIEEKIRLKIALEGGSELFEEFFKLYCENQYLINCVYESAYFTPTGLLRKTDNPNTNKVFLFLLKNDLVQSKLNGTYFKNVGFELYLKKAQSRLVDEEDMFL